jgi:hypothetical protein
MVITAGGKKTHPKRLTMFNPLIGRLVLLAPLYQPNLRLNTEGLNPKWDSA